MKKFSLVFLALVLCTSMLLTSCNLLDYFVQKDDPNNPPVVVVDDLNKETVIQSFNKIDIYAMYMAIEKGVDEVLNAEEVRNFDLHALESQISGELTMGENSADILVTLKDGIVHANLVDTTPGANNREEIYVYLTKTFEAITFELGEDGKWTKAENGDVIEPMPGEPSTPEDNYYGGDGQAPEGYYPSTGYAMTRDTASGVGIGSLSELLGFDADILKRIVIPEIAENQLVAKNGKLVLSNEYFGDLVVANYDLLLELLGAEGAPTKEELKTELVDSLDMVGLEIAFVANENVITGVYVTLAPEETETVINIEVELNDTAKALKRIKFAAAIGTEYGYDDGVSVELTTTLDGNDITAAKIVAEVTATTNDYMGSEGLENGYRDTYVAVCGTYKFEMNVTGIAKDEDLKIEAAFTAEANKAFDVVEFYSYETYESTVTFEEIGTEDYDMDVAATLSIIFNNAAEKCDIDFEFSQEDMAVNVSGTWYFTIAPDAGEVPAEILEYINNYNAE